jgi:hypothetical protein
LINDQKGNGFVSMVFSTLKKCYNGWSDVRTAAKAGEDSEIIRCPAPSIIGAGVPEAFFAALRSKDLSGGFMNRLLILPFEGHRKPPEKKRTVPPEPPQELVDRLKALPRLEVLDDRLDGKLPEPISIPFADDGAEEVYFNLSRKMDEVQRTGNQNQKDLSQRVPEQAARVATNIAVGRGARAVWKPDMEFAEDFVMKSFDAMNGGVEKWMREHLEFPRFCEAVYNKILSAKEMTRRELKRTFRNNQAWGNELDRALDQLVEEERISFHKNLGGSNNSSPGYRIRED